jgi:hypothetical protein
MKMGMTVRQHLFKCHGKYTTNHLTCSIGEFHNFKGLGSWTLFVRKKRVREYMYSAASLTSCPDGVLVLRIFHKVVK